MASDDSNNKKETKESTDLKGFVGDTVKKVLSVGVTAAFMTEEGLRNYVSELKLPKDVLNLLVQGAQKSKDEMTRKVTNEILGIIQKIDFVKEASKFVETHKFKITAEIDVIKKDKSEKSDKSDS